MAKLKTARSHHDSSTVEPTVADTAAGLNLPMQIPLSGASGSDALDRVAAQLLVENNNEEVKGLDGATENVIAVHDLGPLEKT